MARKGLRVCTAVVEHLCGVPALAGAAIIGDEQSPDRLLRRGAERGSAIGSRTTRAPDRRWFRHPTAASRRRDRAGAAARPACAHAPRPGAAPPRAMGRRRSATRCGYAGTRIRLISGPRASKRRSRLSSHWQGRGYPTWHRPAPDRSDPGMRSDRAIARPLTCPKGRRRCGRWQNAAACAAGAVPARSAYCCPGSTRNRRACRPWA